jgi:hydrogenase expression/formation protein HypD
MKLEDVITELKAYDKQVNIMEVCGTHTASIFRNGIRSLISNKIRLISGPGCPVCITPSEYIDRAIEWSKKQDCILLTFGDMMKVAGTQQSLSEAKGDGAKVEIMYSPLDAVKKAKERPDITYVIAAVGFETTVPAYALVLEQIINSNLKNVKFLTALRRVMPALELYVRMIWDNGFLAPGHVSSILGRRRTRNWR